MENYVNKINSEEYNKLQALRGETGGMPDFWQGITTVANTAIERINGEVASLQAFRKTAKKEDLQELFEEWVKCPVGALDPTAILLYAADFVNKARGLIFKTQVDIKQGIVATGYANEREVKKELSKAFLFFIVAITKHGLTFQELIEMTKIQRSMYPEKEEPEKNPMHCRECKEIGFIGKRCEDCDKIHV